MNFKNKSLAQVSSPGKLFADIFLEIEMKREMGRSPRCSKDGLNKGVWAASEDKILRDYVKIHGEGKWRNVAKKTGLKRRGKSCRLRWMNYLRPDIKRDGISQDEEELIIRLHKLLGDRWSLIAGRLPGRADDEIKNYWNTNLAKRAPDFHENKTPPTAGALNGSDPDPEFGMPESVPSKLDHHHNQSSDGSPSAPLSIGNSNSPSDLIMDFDVEDFCKIFDSDYVLDDVNYDRTANSLIEVGDGEDINIVNVMCCKTEEDWPSDFLGKMKENWRSGSEGIQEDHNQTDMDSELLTLASSFLESADEEWPRYHLNI